MDEEKVELMPIGRVESPLRERGEAPKQGDEGAPDAWLEIEERYAAGIEGIEPGSELLVLTWLDRAGRDTLTVHPRGEASRPLTGVFATRSPDRPNPIGLHRVRVIQVEGTRLLVSGLEAIDRTPVLDLKAVLNANIGER